MAWGVGRTLFVKAVPAAAGFYRWGLLNVAASRRDLPILRSQVPLVQAIYEELTGLEDPEAEARKGLDSPVISKVKGV